MEILPFTSRFFSKQSSVVFHCQIQIFLLELGDRMHLSPINAEPVVTCYG